MTCRSLRTGLRPTRWVASRARRKHACAAWAVGGRLSSYPPPRSLWGAAPTRRVPAKAAGSERWRAARLASWVCIRRVGHALSLPAALTAWTARPLAQLVAWPLPHPWATCFCAAARLLLTLGGVFPRPSHWHTVLGHPLPPPPSAELVLHFLPLPRATTGAVGFGLPRRAAHKNFLLRWLSFALSASSAHELRPADRWGPADAAAVASGAL